ncbi:YdcF family protein [bacterium]|nr:YdcF family protein [bacterium]
MFFAFSKLVQPLLWPLNIALLLLSASAAAWYLNKTVWARRLSLIATAVLLVASLPVTALLLLRPIERAFPVISVEQAPAADAIVVLGTTTWNLESPRTEVEEAGGSRLVPAARLYRAKRAPHVVVSSGVHYDAQGADRVEAMDMVAFLIDQGVPVSALVAEQRSRNTDENARYVLEIAKARGWKSILLVTSAFHMKRAVALFKKHGVETVYPFPTEPVVVDRRLRFADFVPDLGSLQTTTRAIRERVGLWVYN